MFKDISIGKDKIKIKKVFLITEIKGKGTFTGIELDYARIKLIDLIKFLDKRYEKRLKSV